MILAVLLLATVVFNQVIALIAWSKNRYSSTAFYHVMATAAFAMWAIGNYGAENFEGDIAVNNMFNQLAYVASFAGVVFLVLFCRSFARHSLVVRDSRVVTGLVAAVLAAGTVLAGTTLVAGTVERNEVGDLLFIQGSLIALYLLGIVGGIAMSVRYLLIRSRSGNYAEKNQARFIIFGFVMALVIGMAANIIIPAISPNFSDATYIVILLTLLLALPTSYALISHRLLDIRPFVARLVAMILLFITLGAAYLTLIFGLNSVFLQDYDQSIGVLSIYAFAMVALGFVVHPLYRYYKNIFGRIFLRRVYESQQVINDLNNVLVANLKLKALMPELQRVIRDNLDAKFTLIKLLSDGGLFHQGSTRSLHTEDLAHLDLALRKCNREKRQIISIRDIAVDPSKKDLTDLMLNHNVAVIASLKQGSSVFGTIYVSVKSTELPYTNQDLEILQIVVNQAGLAIQNALLYQELSSLNASLKERVDLATKELLQTNRKLVSINKAKDEFISIASHQLRTPLTTIKGYISMILDGSFGRVPKSQQVILQQTFDSSQRMSFVVSDLLNLMRLRTGKFKVQAKPADLLNIVSTEVGYLSDLAKQRKIKFSSGHLEAVPTLLLDETKIRQVIQNFIYNALFYTPAGGKIDISLGQEDGQVVFTVADTGIGVPKADQSRLFSQFYRAKNAQAMRPDGTGVGLYISKQIILAHRGMLIFDSTEGKGSTFGFSLPIKTLTVSDEDIVT